MFVPLQSSLAERMKNYEVESKTGMVLNQALDAWLQLLPKPLQKTVGRPTVVLFRGGTLVIGLPENISPAEIVYYRTDLEKIVAQYTNKQGIRVRFRKLGA